MTAASTQHVSVNGAKFICCREALVTRAYEDGTNKDGSIRYSLGFGSQTPPPKEGDTITMEEAFPRLKADIAAREPDVNRRLTVVLTQHAFDALFSLYYQSGTDALAEVSELFNRFQAPEWAIAAFVKHHHNARGEPRLGLMKRRLKEIGLAEGANYGDISKYPFFDGDPKRVARQFKVFPDNV